MNINVPKSFFQRFQKDLFDKLMNSVKPGIVYEANERIYMILWNYIEPRYETMDQWNCNREIQGNAFSEVKWFRLLTVVLRDDGEKIDSVTHFSNNLQIETWLSIHRPERKYLYVP